MFTFKSSSVEEEGADRPAEDGATEKEMEELAAIQAERILQVHKTYFVAIFCSLIAVWEIRFQ